VQGGFLLACHHIHDEKRKGLGQKNATVRVMMVAF